MPKVSVIIPTYNRAIYLLEAIDSILTQTYSDYEIIVIDDGSTDHTVQVLHHLIEQGIIQYVFQDNQGQSAARNHGIQLAKGEYIAFLDSDDLFLPDKLEKQVDFLDDNPSVGLVHSGYTRVDENLRPFGYRAPYHLSGWIYPDLLLHWSVLIAIPAVLVRREILQAVAGFNEQILRSPNEDLWRRIARITPFGVLKEPTCHIRQHSDNYSSDKTGAIKSYSEYIQHAFNDDPGLSAIFRRRVWASMYSNVGHTLLSEHGAEEMRLVRQCSLRSLRYWPFQLGAYIGFLGSFISPKIRARLHQIWLKFRYKPYEK